MPDTPGAADVPLNIWLCPGGPAPGDTARYELAAQVLSEYAPEGGTVLDLAPCGGEVLRAAKAARQSVVAVSTATRCTARPAPPRRHVAEVADLAIFLPPAKHLAPPYRKFALSPAALRTMLAAVTSAVRPGGFVALASLGDPNALTRSPEEASVAGLSFFQHVVALLVPGDRPALRTHVDVLVFARRVA